ncbi:MULTISPECIES: hypothetical protein [unclassified Rhizobium]|jgi:hypothetical protein|uniref:hypothetical protein n=1 Tax=unclassified Rhizobium TaxID=2613769 RepID=UPI0001907A80|nr:MULTISPECIES: hypothetical protein [unclassified Rhizobium]PDT07806.1 hypothetical protein CO655_25325 [Rhizobium sp. M1]PDT33685.1 hypothetical protein CO671_23890 [Rhizobium sp. M10]
MILKIFAPEIDVDCPDTGTYADGIFAENRIDLSSRRSGGRRSSHERDYGSDRKLENLPLGFA